MKKIFLLTCIILLSFLQVQAQSDAISNALNLTKKYATEVAVATPTRSVKYASFLDRNKAISLNIGYNNSYIIGRRKQPNMHGVSGISVGISVYGIYINLAANIEGSHHSNMGVDKYPGYNTLAYHIGYTLPINDWISVTPIIGKSSWQSGYYDGSDYTVDEYGVHNKFYAEDSYNAFDYGAIINVTLFKYVNVFFNITRANIGGGIGMRLPFDVFR